MKTATLTLCLMACLATSGCIIHHKETISPRHEEQEERSRPGGVALAPGSDTGTAR
jgi:hypothetical protein